MPNWCYTNYRIEGDSEELLDLHKRLLRLEDIHGEYRREHFRAEYYNRPVPELPNEISELTYGLAVSSVAKEFGGDWRALYGVGEVASLYEVPSETLLQLTTETAWKEYNEVWDLVVSHYKTIKYYYLAAEIGNGRFITNDTDGIYFPDNFFVYDSINGDSDYLYDEKELFYDMARRLESEEFTSFEELDKYLKDNEFDDDIHYHRVRRITSNKLSATNINN